MGQRDRTAAVAAGFDRSWSSIRKSRNWWPAVAEVECTRLRREAGTSKAALSRAPMWRPSAHRFESGRRSVVRLRPRAVHHLVARGRTAAVEVGRDDHPHAPRRGCRGLVRPLRGASRHQAHPAEVGRDLQDPSSPSPRSDPSDGQPADRAVPGTSSLPAAFEPDFLVEAYEAFIDLARDRDVGIGAKRVKVAAKDVPYVLEDAEPQDCRIGLARVIDFAIAGMAIGDASRAALRVL